MFVVIWDCPRAHKSGQLRALTITPTTAPQRIRYGHSFYGWVLKNGLYDTTIAAPAISSKILCNLSLQHSATFKYIWPQAKCRKRISERDARFKAQNSKLQIFLSSLAGAHLRYWTFLLIFQNFQQTAPKQWFSFKTCDDEPWQ